MTNQNYWLWLTTSLFMGFAAWVTPAFPGFASEGIGLPRVSAFEGKLLTQLNAAQASKDTAKARLVVYTYDAFAADWGPGPKIETAFENVCACDLVFVSADSSIGALRKVQLEGAQTKADIVLGLDNNIAEEARRTGLFAPHEADLSGLDLPIPWQDPLFAPFDYGYFSFVYDERKLSQPPKSFRELVATSDPLTIIIQDPRASTPGLGLLLWIQAAYADDAGEIWAALAPRILNVTKSWSESYGQFLKGEADMVLSYTTSPAYHMIVDKENRYKSAPFSEGHYLQLELAGILKTSKHPDLARRFMRFMYTDAFQDAIPTGNWMYPVVKTKQGLPDAFARLPAPTKTLQLDAATITNNRKKWVEAWQNALQQ